VSRYYRWGFPDHQVKSMLGFEAAKDALRESLSQSVSLRLRADIEVGSYLSGGIDSSAIAALASRHQTSGPRTYSVAFADSTYDESEYQDRVAKHCGTDHRRMLCNYRDISDHFQRAVCHAEVPLFRTAPTPLNLLSQFVHIDGLKVVLSGEGADEILLGYDIFREVKIRRFWQRFPESDVRPQLFKRLYAYLPQFSNPRYANLAIHSFKSSLMSDSPFYSHLLRWANNAANKVYFSPELKDELRDYDCTAALQATLPDEFFSAGEIDRAQYLELVMRQQGINASIMSLGGIVIAIGAMVDAAIVMIDNVHKCLPGTLSVDSERVASGRYITVYIDRKGLTVWLKRG
jgi:asparagine synthase (glutamine-hydrolysing)